MSSGIAARADALARLYRESRDSDSSLAQPLITALFAVVAFDRVGVVDAVVGHDQVAKTAVTVVFTVAVGGGGILVWERLADTLPYPGRPRLDLDLADSHVVVLDGILVGVVFVMGANGIALHSGIVGPDAAGLDWSVPRIMATVGVMIVLVPLEELYFRGYLQRPLAGTAPRMVAVPCATVVFSLFHVPTYAARGFDGMELLAPLSMVFGVGLAAGHVYERTDNLAAAVVVHFGLNLCILVGATVGA